MITSSMALPTDNMAPALESEHCGVEPAWGRSAIVARDPSARRRLSAAAQVLSPGETAWLEIADAAENDRALAKGIARRVKESGAGLVALTADDARIAAAPLLAGGSAVLAVPPAWRPRAEYAHIAVGYDGTESAGAAMATVRALAAACRGSPRVEVVYADDCASAAAELDAEVVCTRRTVMIDWWLEDVARAVPAPVGTARHTGDPVAVLRDVSSDADLLVVGTDGHGALRRLMRRSVSEELIDVTRCPLLIVPRDSPGRALAGTRRDQGDRPARRADHTDGHGSQQRGAERIPAARSGHEERRGLLAPDRRQHLGGVTVLDGHPDVEVEGRSPWFVAEAAHPGRV